MPRALPRSRRRFLRAFFFRRLALPLGQTILQRQLQLLESRLRENHTIVSQQVIRMNFIPRNQLQSVDIARAQLQIAVRRVRRFHNQHRLLNFERVQRSSERLRLCILQLERIHHRQLPIGKLSRQRGTQRAQKLLARERVVIRPRRRTMHGSAVPPQWRPDRADARPSRSLLFPQLFARTGNLPAGLGGMRAAVLPGAVMFHRLPKQIFIHGAENLIGKVKGPDLLTAQIVNINSCHIASRYSVLIPYAFLAALLAAFNGSTVAEPANPRRSLGGFFALMMTRYPPCGPGTLPSTTKRFSSLSTPSTRKLRCVTRAWPICPDMRIPLNTREGNADDPIDPVIWNIDPCDLGPPPK